MLLLMLTPNQTPLLPPLLPLVPPLLLSPSSLSSPVTPAYQCRAVVCEEIPNI